MPRKEIAIPFGGRDWDGPRSKKLGFLCRQRERLAQLGYRGCLGLRGNSLPIDGWAGQVLNLAIDEGLAVYWHPSFNAMFGIGRTGKLNDEQKKMADLALELKSRHGLRHLLVHPDAANFEGYGPKAGFERYYAKHSADYMLRFYENHIGPLREFNERCGGILFLENVHRHLFGQKTKHLMYTYEGEQLGGQETPQLAFEVGCGTGIDSEHFFGLDDPSLADLARPAGRWTKAQRAWTELTGYRVVKGYVPEKVRPMSFSEFLYAMAPEIFHLGGPTRLIEDDLATSHLDFDLRLTFHRRLLLDQINRVEKNGGIIESEVNADDGTGWSPRPKDNWGYQKTSTLKVIRMIERYQAGRVN